jgi:hypothetical protein
MEFLAGTTRSFLVSEPFLPGGKRPVAPQEHPE